MEKEKLLLSRPPPPPPQLSQPHLNSLGSSPSNSTSNSMEFHPHHHHHHQQQQQQQHNHHNNNHVGVGMGLGDLNCFLNLNWENSMMGGGMDDSALSSMVSSPLAPPQLPNSTTTNSLVIRELIGRLGSICNSGDPQFNNSHSTMLELDHQLHQQQQPHNPSLSLDPGFCERAAKYSCFNSSIPRVVDNGNGNGNGNGKLSRVSSTQSLLKATTTTTTSDGGKLLSRSCTPDNNAAEFEESSASDPNLKDVNNNNNNNSSRKRKAAPKPKSKDLPSSTKDSKINAKVEDESNAKRCKPSETTEKEKVVVEPPKDYIHVRARRGQATDSHSLAERIRREKISERMKFLQDLVPGCNKVTGKAVMLDEIINYVQSLQRQVEFLSMKLSTVNPRMEFNMESLLSKDMLQSQGSSALTVHPTDALASTFPYGQPPHQGPSLQNGISNGMENHCSMPLDTAQRLSLSMQLPALDGFSDGDSQLAAFWEDDLQSIVQMGFGQNQGKEVAFQTQNFHGSLPTSHMKVEL